MRALTNWLGNSALRGFEKRALARTVPVCVSDELFSDRNTPVSSRVVRVRSIAETASTAPAARRACSAGMRSCGIANSTSIGASSVIVVMPVDVPEDTRLPTSTARRPTRPLTGAVMRVHSRFSLAVPTAAWSPRTLPCSCLTVAACVSTSWRAIESCFSSVW